MLRFDAAATALILRVGFALKRPSFRDGLPNAAEWVHRHIAAGLTGLTSRCRLGPRPALDEAQMDELVSLVMSPILED